MKLYSENLLLLCIAVLLSAVVCADASWTSAYAGVKHPTGAWGDTDNDSDSSPGVCTSTAIADCNAPDCVARSTTTAQTYVEFSPPHFVIVEKVITDDDKNVMPRHTYQHSGEAHYSIVNGFMDVAGAVQNCELNIDNLNLKVPSQNLGAQYTTNINLETDNESTYTGSFTLYDNGTSSGSGIYDPANFDISQQGDFWVAEYTDAGKLAFELPGNSTEFDLDFSIDSETNCGVGGASDYSVSIDTPGEIVPEPATICLLGLGGILLRRRKRG